MDKCLIRVGISVTFYLTSHPSRSPTNTGEHASQNKMFTFIKSIDGLHAYVTELPL